MSGIEFLGCEVPHRRSVDDRDSIEVWRLSIAKIAKRYSLSSIGVCRCCHNQDNDCARSHLHKDHMGS